MRRSERPAASKKLKHGAQGGEPSPRSGSNAASAKPWSRAELYAAGKALREKTPRRSHAQWKPHAKRADPIEILIDSSQGRLPQLVPIRYGRMLQSPFTFYRGAAAVMAADLSRTPSSGIHVQACGDCHLLNFGIFATPERRVIFDINDFDETHPAPWEWDVMRLAASFVIAGRNNGFSARECRDAAQAAAGSYRERTAELAQMPTLEQWYVLLDAEELISKTVDTELRKLRMKRLQKATAHTSAEVDYPKLVEHVGGRPTIRDDPPLVFHSKENEAPEFERNVQEALKLYRASLQEDRRYLFDRYRLADIAVKVVGIGSVGTVCAVGLFLAYDDDPLFLQIKQARTSVLAPYVRSSAYANEGQRVVVGQRLMQAASDLFLGWTQGRKGRHFYVRQLRDVKLKPMVEIFNADNLQRFASGCGWALARAHARSGYASLIAGYLGGSPVFDEAIARFAQAYADQNERDHNALVKAVRAGRVEAVLDR